MKNSPLQPRVIAVLALGLFPVLAACLSKPSLPQSLATISVPPNFTFPGTQPVEVTVTARPGGSVPEAGAMLSINRADGKLVYQGALRVVGAVVHLHYVLHRRHIFRRGNPRQAPALLRPRLQLVFF